MELWPTVSQTYDAPSDCPVECPEPALTATPIAGAPVPQILMTNLNTINLEDLLTFSNSEMPYYTLQLQLANGFAIPGDDDFELSTNDWTLILNDMLNWLPPNDVLHTDYATQLILTRNCVARIPGPELSLNQGGSEVTDRQQGLSLNINVDYIFCEN